jgi:hypothetical protein
MQRRDGLLAGGPLFHRRLVIIVRYDEKDDDGRNEMNTNARTISSLFLSVPLIHSFLILFACRASPFFFHFHMADTEVQDNTHVDVVLDNERQIRREYEWKMIACLIYVMATATLRHSFSSFPSALLTIIIIVVVVVIIII